MLYVIRHGQTALNRSHALQGRSDQPLNEAGEDQARAVGAWLAQQHMRFSAAYSSPLQRAIRTAELVAPGVPVTTDERLIEMDYGPYEGADLRNMSPELAYFFSDFVNHPAPEGMEPLSSVVARAGAFVEELADLSGNVLVSTHAIAMKGLLEYLTPASRGSYWATFIGNCAVYAVEREGGSWGVPHKVDIAS